mgnify:CR=1 FL=1
MIIAVASGKGGTGKTTVATSLALAAAGSSHAPGSIPADVLYLDCDVEAPNAHLFLKPTFQERREVGILIPEVDETVCTHCGRCAERHAADMNSLSSRGRLGLPKVGRWAISG